MSDLADSFSVHYAAVAKGNPGVAAIVLEAQRIIERLDELDKIISGKTDFMELLHFRMGLDGETVRVTLDGALSESRQQANTLRQLIAQLDKVEVAAPAGNQDENPLAKLLREREERKASGG